MGGDTTPATSSSTQTSTPWGPQIPFLQAGFQNAYNDILNGPTPQQTFSPQSQAALSNIYQSNSGVTDPNLSAASNLNTSILQGSGPGFNQETKAITDAVAPQINSQFERSGGYGSGLNQVAMSNGIADSLINKQQQAIQSAPVLDNATNALQQGALQRQLGVGQTIDSANNANQMARTNQILNFMHAIGGNYGGTVSGNSTSTPASGSNDWLTGLGSALSLGSLFSAPAGGTSAMAGLMSFL